MGVSMSKVMMSVGAGGAASMLIYALWKIDKPDTRKYAIMGLRNCGNSCFLNAVMQAIASCEFVLGWLRQKDVNCNYNYVKPVEPLETLDAQNYPLIAAMLRGILIINRDIDGDDHRFTCKVPGDILAGLRLNGYKIGVHQEQDAYEVFLLIAMALNHEVESSIRRKQTGSMSVLTDGRTFSEPSLSLPESEEVNPSVDMSVEGGEWAVVFGNGSYRINERIYSKRLLPMDSRMDYKTSPNLPFRTLMLTQMQCLICMTKTKVRIEATDAFTLNLPAYNPAIGLTLHDLLIRFMRPTLLHGVDCDTCTKNRLGGLAYPPNNTKVKTVYYKYNFIGKLPNTLCIHIPRCTWGEGGMHKRTDFVSFPDRINLGMLKRFYDGQPHEFELDAYKIFKQEPDHECGLRRFRNSEYGLVAVISHMGSVVDSGHFVTYRKVVHKDNPNLSSWYYVSDDLVNPVPLSHVLGTRAYMLFYEKIQVKA